MNVQLTPWFSEGRKIDRRFEEPKVMTQPKALELAAAATRPDPW
jgi:hypothetical protein